MPERRLPYKAVSIVFSISTIILAAFVITLHLYFVKFVSQCAHMHGPWQNQCQNFVHERTEAKLDPVLMIV